MFKEIIKHYDEVKKNQFLKKQIFSDNRLLFVAGIEGTGHHAFGDMFDVCLKAVSLAHRCYCATDLSREFFFNRGQKKVTR
jgi:hypothetical protein